MPLPDHRRGITLLEVLISMGILTIGIVSVLSLIPTGRSFAVKATVYDRVTAVADNAIADIINRGYLDPVRYTLSTISPTRIDFLGFANGSALVSGSFTDTVPTSNWPIDTLTTTVPFAIQASSDDLVYTLPTNDAPPSPGRTANGVAVAENKFSWAATLTSPSGTSAAGTTLSGTASGTPALLSVVVFHRRDLSGTGQLSVSGTATGTTVTISGVTSTTKNYLRAGNVVLCANGSNYSWRRLLLTAFDDPNSQALLTVGGASLTSGNSSAPVTIWVFVGAVGLAERLVRLEGPSPWSLP